MDAIRAQFVASTVRGARAGFEWASNEWVRASFSPRARCFSKWPIANTRRLRIVSLNSEWGPLNE